MTPEITRRRAMQVFGTATAATARLEGQQLAGEPEGRITPLGEIINTFEFELMAKRKLSAEVFSTVSGGDRADIEQCTFRAQLMVDTSKLNLTTELFGQSLLAPIVAGPASEQRKIHADGELAMVRGAAAAKAIVVISSSTSYPIEEIMKEAKGPVWAQVFAGIRWEQEKVRAQRAVKLGCKVVVITARTPQELDWVGIDRMRQGLNVPIVVKGIRNPRDAASAVKHGVDGIVVSNYGAALGPSPFAVLPSVVDAVGGKVPVLIDGGFRRGTDILKALIVGAQAVLVTRPALWGLAAYGADGVQAVLEMTQTELARNMIMIGASTPKELRRNMIRFHKP